MNNLGFQSVKYRTATLDDKEAILELWRLQSEWLGGVYAGKLKNLIEKGTVHVAEFNGEIIGFVQYHIRRDNWSTIYSIAVHPDYYSRNVGRFLLWSVPCPIQLKVTADNERAIRFYEHLNMIRADTSEARSGRKLYTYKLHTLFIQVAGRNAKFASVAHNAGIPYGTRNTDKAYSQPFMLDVDWRGFKSNKFTWYDYMETVKTYRPVMAMCVDYEHPSEKKMLINQIRDLQEEGVLRVMVCPKFQDAILDIPNDENIVIGVSIPSEHAGFLPKPQRLTSRRIHLLGGTPHKQREYMMKYRGENAIVASVDGNSHERASTKGTVWRDGAWKKLTTNEQVDKYATMTESARNLAKMFQRIGLYKQLRLPMF